MHLAMMISIIMATSLLHQKVLKDSSGNAITERIETQPMVDMMPKEKRTFVFTWKHVMKVDVISKMSSGSCLKDVLNYLDMKA